MRFSVLGHFEVTHDDRIYTPSAPKVRQVLAVLALRATEVVSVDALIEELWGENPPKSAVTTAQTYIYQLRQAFREPDGNEAALCSISTRLPGYTLEIDREHIDASAFTHLLDEGRRLLEKDERDEACRVLHQALGLWSGPALGNVTCGPLLRRYATHLEESRITALELRIAADMRIGRHRELIPELRSLVSLHPFNEWLHAQLIISLYKAGRRGDALRAYQELARILNLELGLDPSADLQRIHRAVLASDELSERMMELPL